MKHIVLSVLTLMSCLSFQSCSEEDIMHYEGGNAVHFLANTIQDSFVTDLTQESKTLSIPVQLVGNIPDEDLTFKVEIVEDEEFTTAQKDHYSIVGTTVPKGQIQGSLDVVLKNPEMLNIGTKNLKVRFKLVDNETVKAGGWRDYLVIDLTWSSDYVQPKTWRAMGQYIISNRHHWSPNVYRAYIAATGLTEFYGSLAGIVDPETGAYWSTEKQYAVAKKFGDWIRQWNEDHYPEVYCHDGDDPELFGTPITPRF